MPGGGRRPPLPLSSPTKGARASEASTRGMQGRRGAGSPTPIQPHNPTHPKIPVIPGSDYPSSFLPLTPSSFLPQPPSFLRRQESSHADHPSPPSLQRKGDADERSENAGGCPRADADHLCPFRPRRKGRVRAKQARGVCRGGGGAAPRHSRPSRNPTTQTIPVPLRASVRGTRTSGARTQGDARGRTQTTSAPFVADERGACERSKHAGYARGGGAAHQNPPIPQSPKSPVRNNTHIPVRMYN